MGKVFGLFVAIWSIVAKYPALSAGLANILIVAGAQVGLHLSTAELASIAGGVAALFGVLVTAGVIPVTKVDNVKAGIRNKVPNGGAVLVPAEAESAPKPPENPAPEVGLPEGYVPPSASLNPPVVLDTHATFTPEPKPEPVSKLGKPINPTRKVF